MLQSKNRNFDIDCLRVIGLICIILAHIPRVPAPLMALRRFDVPFMVVISGYLFSKSKSKNEDISIITYLYSRIKRLVYPTWIFLTIFFLGNSIVSKMLGIDFVEISTVLRSYLLIDGIGYVWIIRIYLIVGVLGPLLVKKMKINIYYILFYYILFEMILVSFDLFKIKNSILEVLILTPLPYVLFFVYGFIFSSFEKIKKFNFYNFIFGIFIISFGYFLYRVKREWFFKFYLKYPPRLLYIFYGILISNLLIFNRNIFFRIHNIYFRQVVSFIGKSTLWIYLWHIVIIYGILFLERKIIIDYKILFSVTVIISTVITFLQNKIIDYLIEIFPNTKNKIEVLFKG